MAANSALTYFTLGNAFSWVARPCPYKSKHLPKGYRMMNAKEAIAEILQREGVEYLFCFPTTPIIDACSEAGIRPLVARQERVAGNMADGYSRMTNGKRIGVCSVQRGAGAENCFSAVTQAYTDSSPVLFVAGQVQRQVADLNPNFNAARTYRNATKWSERIPSGPMTETYLRKAFTLLRSGRPRPVFLELCVDVAEENVPELNYLPPPRLRSCADPQSVKEAVTTLLEAKHPVIWAGQGVLYAEASAELTTLAELLGIPVTTSLLGKSAFNEQHPLSLGTASFSKTAMVASALEEADVLLTVGASLSRDFTASYIPAGKRHLHCTVDPGDMNTYFSIDVGLVGDAKLVLQQILEELRDRLVDRTDMRIANQAKLGEQRERWNTRWAAKRTSNETPINIYRLVADFEKTFDPATSVVTHEPGATRDVLVPQYKAVNPRGYLGWGHSTQLGFSLGSAMGAKLACPEKLVANFMGDCGIGMVGTDLETAARLCIPILTVISNNGTMGNYGRLIPRSKAIFGVTELGGNYTDMALALGLHAERVERPAEIIPALRRGAQATAEGTPALVEVITGVEPDISYQG